MTPLTKQVARKSTGNGPNRRRYVVTLAPGDVIGFRDERRRKTFWLSISACYELAIRSDVAAEKRMKKKARKGWK